ncbi:DNA topoisomerase III [Pectobacterium carotovorum]|uniref:type IA DNA topoisomerase n=1 Tax=Pectobacterium versatile TaxID=2488639 RepID=UPI000C7E9D2B|nr:type IA DNA topoisomerase [Pectobacterium versatile]PLY35853.1 DNA topoisomerase III [Pectobacterium carotovorum]
MRVFIAEKPSLAKAIFEGLGGNPNTEKQNGYFQHGSDVVTWCYGHMLELCDPQDYDPKYSNWQFGDLPIKTTFPPTYKMKSESEAQTRIILSLIEKATGIVNAGDPDDEGQLLVDEILGYANNKKPVQRLHVADLNLAPVKKSLANMQPNEQFRGMTNSALSRALLDQSFGYNLTRGCTLKGREKGYQGVLNVGRVQSAVLGLVNLRTLANQQHAESFYYDVFAQLELKGNLVKAKYQVTDSDQIDEKKRLISEAQAKHIAERISGNEAIVTIAATKTENTKPPLPLNLSTLQQICAKRYGYKAKETDAIMQGLYETHKLLTYPRTDNRYLSDEHFYQAGDIAAAISATMPELAAAVADMDKGQKHKAFNASKIEAHHAIVPTTKSGASVQLNEKEKNVYRIVATYFIGLFWPDAIRNKTKVHFDIKGDTFTATQSVMVQKGWEALGKDSADDEDVDDQSELTGFDLATLKFNDSGLCESSNVDKKPALPPKYFTESSLLAAMTRAAKFIDDPVLRKSLEAKDEGSTDQGSIGTEATRSGILEKLAANTGLISIEKEKGYSELVWKTTTQGQEFCAALPQEVVKPDISALWAEKQAQIKAGTLTVTDFIKETDAYISGLIGELEKNGINISSNQTPCPVCKKGFLLKKKGANGFFWGCSCYPDCKTTFPDKDGKPVTEKQTNSANANRLEVPCPNCGGAIVVSPKRFSCCGCKFGIWSIIATKKITNNQAETLIKKGKTAVLKGFKSKEDKPFDAALVLKDKSTGAVTFEFEKKKK